MSHATCHIYQTIAIALQALMRYNSAVSTHIFHTSHVALSTRDEDTKAVNTLRTHGYEGLLSL